MLAGQPAGPLLATSGGTLVAEVAVETGGSTRPPKKHVSAVHHEPLALRSNVPVNPSLLSWIASTLSGATAVRSGSVIRYDAQFRAISELTFQDALITEIVFPTLDATSKEPGFLEISVALESARVLPGSGAINTAFGAKQKAWPASNFRFELDGLDTKRVIKVESFKVAQSVTSDAIGVSREPTIDPSELVVPTLEVTIAAAGAASWQAWYNDFLVNGRHLDSYERQGRIVFLSPDGTTELLVLNLSHVGLLALRPGQDSSGTLHAQLYAEQIAITGPTAQ